MSKTIPALTLCIATVCSMLLPHLALAANTIVVSNGDASQQSGLLQLFGGVGLPFVFIIVATGAITTMIVGLLNFQNLIKMGDLANKGKEGAEKTTNAVKESRPVKRAEEIVNEKKRRFAADYRTNIANLPVVKQLGDFGRNSATNAQQIDDARKENAKDHVSTDIKGKIDKLKKKREDLLTKVGGWTDQDDAELARLSDPNLPYDEASTEARLRLQDKKDERDRAEQEVNKMDAKYGDLDELQTRATAAAGQGNDALAQFVGDSGLYDPITGLRMKNDLTRSSTRAAIMRATGAATTGTIDTVGILAEKGFGKVTTREQILKMTENSGSLMGSSDSIKRTVNGFEDQGLYTPEVAEEFIKAADRGTNASPSPHGFSHIAALILDFKKAPVLAMKRFYEDYYAKAAEKHGLVDRQAEVDDAKYRLVQAQKNHAPPETIQELTEAVTKAEEKLKAVEEQVKAEALELTRKTQKNFIGASRKVGGLQILRRKHASSLSQGSQVKAASSDDMWGDWFWVLNSILEQYDEEALKTLMGGEQVYADGTFFHMSGGQTDLATYQTRGGLMAKGGQADTRATTFLFKDGSFSSEILRALVMDRNVATETLLAWGFDKDFVKELYDMDWGGDTPEEQIRNQEALFKKILDRGVKDKKFVVDTKSKWTKPNGVTDDKPEGDGTYSSIHLQGDAQQTSRLITQFQTVQNQIRNRMETKTAEQLLGLEPTEGNEPEESAQGEEIRGRGTGTPRAPRSQANLRPAGAGAWLKAAGRTFGVYDPTTNQYQLDMNSLRDDDYVQLAHDELYGPSDLDIEAKRQRMFNYGMTHEYGHAFVRASGLQMSEEEEERLVHAYSRNVVSAGTDDDRALLRDFAGRFAANTGRDPTEAERHFLAQHGSDLDFMREASAFLGWQRGQGEIRTMADLEQAQWTSPQVVPMATHYPEGALGQAMQDLESTLENLGGRFSASLEPLTNTLRLNAAAVATLPENLQDGLKTSLETLTKSLKNPQAGEDAHSLESLSAGAFNGLIPGLRTAFTNALADGNVPTLNALLGLERAIKYGTGVTNQPSGMVTAMVGSGNAKATEIFGQVMTVSDSVQKVQLIDDFYAAYGNGGHQPVLAASPETNALVASAASANAASGFKMAEMAAAATPEQRGEYLQAVLKTMPGTTDQNSTRAVFDAYKRAALVSPNAYTDDEFNTAWQAVRSTQDAPQVT